MANNRNDSERRYLDERGHAPRSDRDRDYDPYRYPYRDREVDRGETERETGWRGAYRERFARRSSDNRDMGGQYPSFDRDYDHHGSSDSTRYFNRERAFPASYPEFDIPDWRFQGLRPFYGSPMTNDYGSDMFRMARSFGRVNYAGRGPKGYRRSDDRIKEDVCDVLERHPAIDASEIEIAVKDGVVILRGAVENRAQKRLAEDSIENLTGVKDVRNELSINQELFMRSRGSAEGELANSNPTSS